jgi:hypothetical protein
LSASHWLKAGKNPPYIL